MLSDYDEAIFDLVNDLAKWSVQVLHVNPQSKGKRRKSGKS